MSLIDRFRSWFAASGRPSVTDNFWYNPIGWLTGSGMPVSEDKALTYSAVWAATRLLSGSIGYLPLDLYRRLPGGGREIVDTDSRETLVHDSPNVEMRAMVWRALMSSQQINAGNAYAAIERDLLTGLPVNLWPIHHTRVKPFHDESGRLLYEVRQEGDRPIAYDAMDMLHIQSMVSDDGITGKGVIAAARESIGFGLATEKYGANFFQGQGIPRVVVSHPNKLSPEARMNFRKEWKDIHGGPSGDRVALLAEGATLSPLNISQEDSQFLETRQHNIEEIARWYGVPPHLLQDLRRATFSNIEELGIVFVVHSLVPWLKIWEQELWAKLLTKEEQRDHFFEFNVMGLLRGNSAGRADYFQKMLTSGVLSVNEVRAVENYNPVENGDVRFIQGAMQPVDLLIEQSQANIDSTRQQMEAAEQVEPVLDNNADDSPDDTTSNVAAEAVRDAAFALVESTVARLTRKESADAVRAARDAGGFLAWLDAFYGRHEAYLAEDLDHPCRALRACGVQVLPEAIASDLCRDSRDRLLEISGECTAATLVAKIETEVSGWPARKPKALIERLRA